MAQALPLIYLGVTAASAGLAYTSQRRAGALQENAYKEQAKEEEFSARDREIQRRQRLIQAIASQNSEGGALGIDPTSGSPRAILLEDAKRAKFDDLTDRAMTTRRAATLRSTGREARRSSNIQAGATLLDTAGSIAGAG